MNRDVNGHLRGGGGPVDRGNRRRPPESENRITKWFTL